MIELVARLLCELPEFRFIEALLNTHNAGLTNTQGIGQKTPSEMCSRALRVPLQK